MNAQALVIGNHIAGLVTAFRLQQHGFSVNILEHPDGVEPPTTLPLLFHGSQTYTRSVFSEIGILSSLKTLEQVSLEFLDPSNRRTAFRPAFFPAPWHALVGFLRCSALSPSSRWNFLNYVEKIWEGVIALPPKLHFQTAHEWLKTGGQDEKACREFWNPLCLFLLKDHLGQTSAWSFMQALKHHTVDARGHSRIRMPLAPLETFLQAPLRARIQKGGGTFIPFVGFPRFQMTGNHIGALSMYDGCSYHADVYISTLSPFQLTDLLPERILARLGYFHQFNQLNTVPAVIVHHSVPGPCPKSRLVLTSGPFSWLTRHQIPSDDAEVYSRISAIAIANGELLSESDDTLRLLSIREIQRAFPGFPPTHSHQLSSCDITRKPRAFLTHAPGTMTFRPSHQTPIDNLFLAGYWTERGGASMLEADVHSAHICANLIHDRVLSR